MPNPNPSTHYSHSFTVAERCEYLDKNASFWERRGRKKAENERKFASQFLFKYLLCLYKRLIMKKNMIQAADTRVELPVFDRHFHPARRFFVESVCRVTKKLCLSMGREEIREHEGEVYEKASQMWPASSRPHPNPKKGKREKKKV